MADLEDLKPEDQEFMESELSSFMERSAARGINLLYLAKSLQRAASHVAVMAGVSDQAIAEGCEYQTAEARIDVAKALDERARPT